MSSRQPAPLPASRAAASEGMRRDRVGAVARALAEPARDRIDAAIRATVDAHARDLVDTVERDVIERLSRLLDGFPVSAGHAGAALRAAGIGFDPPLAAHLLRRADEHRLVRALRRPDASAALVDCEPRETLADHPDAEIATAARALAAAMATRCDDTLAPRLELHEIEPAALHALAWTVAAALRGPLTARAEGTAAVDHAVALAVGELLGGVQHDRAVGACAVRLAGLLDARGLLDDVMIVDALSAAQPALCVAALARRVGIGLDGAWDMLFDQSGAALVRLLRAAAVARDEAVAIVALLHGINGARDEVLLAALAAQFDCADQQEAVDAVALWRLAPAYREAIIALAGRE